jgi:hypothetical protein
MSNYYKYPLIAIISAGAYLLFFMNISKSNSIPYKVDKSYQSDLYNATPEQQKQISIIKSDTAYLIKIYKEAMQKDKTIPAMLLSEAERKVKIKNDLKKRHLDLMAWIRQDSIWMSDIVKGAKERGITQEEMIMRASKYVINEEIRNENH